MLTVFPEKDEKILAKYYEESGFSLSEKSGGVTAKLNDELLGYCIFDIDNGTVSVLDITPKDDIMLFDGILRSALHVAAERFIFNADYKNDALEETLSKIGFIKDKSLKTLDMDKLFGGCTCGGGK